VKNIPIIKMYIQNIHLQLPACTTAKPMYAPNPVATTFGTTTNAVPMYLSLLDTNSPASSGYAAGTPDATPIMTSAAMSVSIDCAVAATVAPTIPSTHDPSAKFRRPNRSLNLPNNNNAIGCDAVHTVLTKATFALGPMSGTTEEYSTAASA
jgi:hypothetical protein